MTLLADQIARKVFRKLLRKTWRVECKLSPNKVRVFTIDRQLGVQIAYPLNTSVGYGLYCRDYESAELGFVKRTLQAGDVFLDIGANGGIFTALAARCVGPTGHVYAFEPGEPEQALLEQNIVRNHLTNVTVFRGAVSNQTGTANLAVARDGALNSLAKTEHPLQSIKEWRPVPTITLDEYLARERVPKVDFVKMDVEGAEKLVLDGAVKLLGAAQKLTILFEAFDLNAKGFGYTVAQLLESLWAQGFALGYLQAQGALVSFPRWEPRLGSEIYNFVARK
jgi:FkbM family methyltransferase